MVQGEEGGGGEGTFGYPANRSPSFLGQELRGSRGRGHIPRVLRAFWGALTPGEMGGAGAGSGEG